MLTVAQFYATGQIIVAGIVLLVSGLGLAGGSYHGSDSLAVFFGAFVATAVGAAFMCRLNGARMFLAGLYALASVGIAAMAVYAVCRGGGFAALYMLPLLLASVAGAFAFVAADVRAWCGEPVRV